MSVLGIELFREAMRGHEGSYALIGGSACDLLMEAQGGKVSSHEGPGCSHTFAR